MTDSNCEAASLIKDPATVRDILPGSYITEIDGDICACSEHHCNTPLRGLSACILQQSNYSKYKFMQLFDFLVGISAQRVTFRPIIIVDIINIYILNLIHFTHDAYTNYSNNYIPASTSIKC